MTPTYVVIVEGLDGFKQAVDGMSPAIQRAALRAVGKTTDRARAKASREAREQVAFRARYLGPSGGRLNISKRPRKGDLTGIISGRDRPTSLAQFSREKPLAPGKRSKKGGVKVTVKPGSAHVLPRSFLLELKGGNVGLAVRTEGPAPAGAWKPKRLGKNLWLLYGPSVDQVLMRLQGDSGVFPDISPETLDFLEREFLRLVNLEQK